MSTQSQTSRISRRGLLAGGCLLLTAGCGEKSGPAGTTPVAREGDRLLVVIVPGTFGNAAFWPTVQPDRASFASELLRAASPESEVHSAVWASTLTDAKRAQAAERLAAEIDDRAAGFDRVAVVGHSHGGNIGLLAAGLCRTPIDTVVCLSTPHAHLATRLNGSAEALLPVYCTPRTLSNTRRIVTVIPNTDKVPSFWAGLFAKGIGDEAALRLTESWQDATARPRLRRDDPLTRLLKIGNVTVTDRLNVETDHVELHSLVLDPVGLKPHYAVHSRRMGYVLGELLAAGADEASLDYLRTMVQPKSADDGEPVPAAEHAAWTAKYRQYFEHAGWRLTHAGVSVDRGRPDLVLKVKSADGRQMWGRTPTASDSDSAAWKPWIFVYDGVEFQLQLDDENGVFPPTSLGARTLRAGRDLPRQLALPGWRGEFTWQAAHH